MCECLEYEDGDIYLCEVCGPEHSKLEEQNRIMREALEKYADPCEWYHEDICCECGEWCTCWPRVFRDRPNGQAGYRLAQEALRKAGA